LALDVFGTATGPVAVVVVPPSLPVAVVLPVDPPVPLPVDPPLPVDDPPLDVVEPVPVAPPLPEVVVLL